jgi:uncharacterized zinc-type alcohol dehydrogenase-like protein
VLKVKALATSGPQDSFQCVEIERRDVGPHDVLIDIRYAGICHSDLHHARAEIGTSHFPMVPGHEIVGVVSEVGRDVTRLQVGDIAGVGCMVDSCRECGNCRAGLEQYCRVAKVLTYNAVGRDGKVTQGGYSEQIVVDEHFAVRVPPSALPLESIAPLLCAGITLYSPLRHWHAGPGTKVAIVGFGGLGHVGTQIAHALGAHTTVLELSADRREDALRLGADEFLVSSDPQVFDKYADAFDLILSTVPVSVDLDRFLGMLRTDGTFVNIGVSGKPLTIDAYSLFRNRRSIAGSLIGGMEETQEMIDFCVNRGIGAEVEMVNADDVDAAYARLERGDVRYRFVIDVETLSSSTLMGGTNT